MTYSCEQGYHDLCDGIVDLQQGCNCPCHKLDDAELFGEDEDRDR